MIKKSGLSAILILMPVFFACSVNKAAPSVDSGGLIHDVKDTIQNVDTVNANEIVADSLTDSSDPGQADIRQDTGIEVISPECKGQWVGKPWPVEADSTFLRGPYIQSVYPDSAIIVWRTDTVLTDEGCVHYWVDSKEKVACVSPNKLGQYEVKLTGLPA